MRDGGRRDWVTTTAIVVACVALALLVRAAYGQGNAQAGTKATDQASAYGPGLYGNHLACGGRLWPATKSIAHRWLSCGTRLRVCYARRCTSARVRDRGPYAGSRALDLSEAVVRALGVRTARQWGVRVVVWKEIE